MTTKFITGVLAAAIMAVVTSIPSQAEKSAQPTTVKFGYFNLSLVKVSFPEAAGSERLRLTAEAQLRHDVEEGNKRLQKMQEDKKDKSEIQKAASNLQQEINAKQQALIELVQSQTAMATQEIATAVSSIAKEKGLDVVVDVNGVFAGGEKLVTNGEDITEAIVKKLQPQALQTKQPTSAK